MASDSILHGLFRSLETCIHERLSMIEEVCRGKGERHEISEPTGKYGELLNCIQTLESRITAIESNIQDLKTKTLVPETVHVNCIGKDSKPQMWIEAMKDLEIILPAPPAVESVEEVVEEEEEAEEAEEEVEEVEAEEEVEEVEEAEEVEAEVEEVEEAEQEEEEVEEVEEITFKNKNYYKDSSNNIYGISPDGQPSDQPIGVWDDSRQRILFKRVQ